MSRVQRSTFLKNASQLDDPFDRAIALAGKELLDSTSLVPHLNPNTPGNIRSLCAYGTVPNAQGDDIPNTYRIRFSLGGYRDPNDQFSPIGGYGPNTLDDDPFPILPSVLRDWIISSYPEFFLTSEYDTERQNSQWIFKPTISGESPFNFAATIKNLGQRLYQNIRDPQGVIRLRLSMMRKGEPQYQNLLNSVSNTTNEVLREEVQRVDGQLNDIADTVSTLIERVSLEPVDMELLLWLCYNLLTSEEKVVCALNNIETSRSSRFQSFGVVVSNPYVLRRSSSKAIYDSDVAVPFHHLNPEYNYYLECYEEQIQEPYVDEKLLPNLYIHGMSLRGVATEAVPGFENFPGQRVSPQWGFGDEAEGVDLQSKYDYHTTLGALVPLPQFQMDTMSLYSYLNKVGNTFAAGSLGPVEQGIMKTLSDSLIFAQDDYDIYNSISHNVKFFPMKIDVQMSFGQTGQITKALNDYDMDTVISRMVERESQSLNSSSVGQVMGVEYSTAYLYYENNYDWIRNRNSITYQYHQYETIKSLEVYDLDRLVMASSGVNMGGLGRPMPGNYQSGLLISSWGSDPLGELNPAEEVRLRDSYLDIMNWAQLNVLPKTPFQQPKPFSGDPVFYKLEKLDKDNEIIQNFYFSNGKNIAGLTYSDIQIKYGKEYNYRLYEYVAVAGVSEEMTPVDLHLPEWIYNRPEMGDALEAFRERLRGLGLSGLGNLGWGDLGDFGDLGVNTPLGLLQGWLDSHTEQEMGHDELWYDFIVQYKPIVKIIKHQVVGPDIVPQEYVDQGNPIPRGLEFPPVKVLDRPPLAPDVLPLPLQNNYRQTKVIANPQVGRYLGPNALKNITIESDPGRFELADYQREFEYYELPSDRLEFANEGRNEIKQMTIYYTSYLDTNVDSYEALYSSFDPMTNPSANKVVYATDPEVEVEDSSGTTPGFTALVNMEPNLTYYLTCTLGDIHQNQSNPSPIYEIRLNYEKGMYIPEIKLFEFEPVSNQQSTRKFARFIRIQASDIQSFPTVRVSDDGEITSSHRNLGAELGDTVTNQDFIIRLTSIDTGRKFDLRLSFNYRDPSPSEEQERCAPPQAINVPDLNEQLGRQLEEGDLDLAVDPLGNF